MMSEDDDLLMANAIGNDSEAYSEAALHKEDIGYVGPDLTWDPEKSGASVKESYCCNPE